MNHGFEKRMAQKIFSILLRIALNLLRKEKTDKRALKKNASRRKGQKLSDESDFVDVSIEGLPGAV